MLEGQHPMLPANSAEFAARLGAVAEGIRATQRQRNAQRRAAKLRASQVRAELMMLREDLHSLQALLRRCGADLLHEVAEALEGVAALAVAQGEQAAERAASASFSVFLCSHKHTAQELAACAWIVRAREDGLRAGLAEIKVQTPRVRAGAAAARSQLKTLKTRLPVQDKLVGEQRLLKRDAQRIVEAVHRFCECRDYTPCLSNTLVVCC